MKKRRRQKPPRRPQEFEHRVQVVLEALAATVSGADLLTSFLIEQTGPQWRDQRPKAMQAARELRRACRWLKGIDSDD